MVKDGTFIGRGISGWKSGQETPFLIGSIVFSYSYSDGHNSWEINDNQPTMRSIVKPG